jgi:zinc transport system substrate-binding protein
MRGLTLLVLLAACGTAAPRAPSDGRIPVAVSVPPQAYFVEKIGADRVRVEVMIPPGVSHEDYSPSPRQVVALSDARLYVKVGHPAFEVERRFIDPFLARMPGIRVVDMSRGMDFIQGEGSEDQEHAGSDPHVWVAPATVRVAARNIAASLAATDPAHAAEYQANLRAFLAEIDALDREIRDRLGPGTPGRVRRFMVYHPSWGYFAHEYGLEQVAIEAEGKEPSAQRLIQLIDRGRREGVKVIFVPGGFPRKSAQVIADAVGGRVLTANPEERDWADNLRRVAAELGAAYGGPHPRPSPSSPQPPAGRGETRRNARRLRLAFLPSPGAGERGAGRGAGGEGPRGRPQ